jgi:hypothetical protein
MPFTSGNTAAVRRFLPVALDIFCKPANEAEQAEIDHNGCIRQRLGRGSVGASERFGHGSPAVDSRF